MSKKVAFYGVFASLAVTIAFLERFIPVPTLPGAKLGLANVVVLMVLYTYNARSALPVAVLRIVVVGLLFGSITSMAYSISGGLLSFVIMIVAKKIGIFGVVGVSVLGGVAHNVAQIAVAAAVVGDIRLFYNLPWLILIGAATGVLVGYTAGFSVNNIKVIQRFR